uniref:Uncharacterized protein n=1 Tax=Anopheles culicifacies TaxID=139723 RepID=A0A182LXW3_9DIPT
MSMNAAAPGIVTNASFNTCLARASGADGTAGAWLFPFGTSSFGGTLTLVICITLSVAFVWVEGFLFLLFRLLLLSVDGPFGAPATCGFVPIAVAVPFDTHSQGVDVRLPHLILKLKLLLVQMPLLLPGGSCRA